MSNLRALMSHLRRVVRERWLAIAVVAGVFFAVAAIIESNSPTTYTAIAKVEFHEVVPGTDPVFVLIRPLVPDVPARYTSARVASLANTPPVIRAADERLGPAYGTVAGRVIARTGLEVVDIGVLDADPKRAAQGANAVAEALVEYINDREVERLDSIIDAVQKTRRTIRRRRENYESRIRLNETLFRLRTLRGVAEAARVIEPAIEPAGPSFVPGRRRDLAILVGLSLGLIAAVVLDGMSRRPRDPRRLARAARLPIAALLPKPRPGGTGAVAAGLDRLRTSLRDRAWVTNPVRSVLLTSAVPDDAAAVAGVGLAEAAAASGQRVCLLEGALGRPVLAERLSITAQPDLVDVLEGRASHADAVASVESPLGGRPIDVLAAREPSTRAADLLHSPRLASLLEELQGMYDLVVVHGGALLVSAEPAILDRWVDGVLLTARAGRTHLEELQAAADELDRLAPPAAALVVLDVYRQDLAHERFVPPESPYPRTVREPEPERLAEAVA